MNLVSIGTIAGVILVALFVLGLILTRLYRRASKEVSFVRTGFGGEKVIMNGGAMVLPVLHEIIPVNMNTLRLEVRRAAQQALITRDRMRVDVMAEFYVRVKGVLRVEKFEAGLVEAGQGNGFEFETVFEQVFTHDLLYFLNEINTFFMQFFHRHFGGNGA